MEAKNTFEVTLEREVSDNGVLGYILESFKCDVETPALYRSSYPYHVVHCDSLEIRTEAEKLMYRIGDFLNSQKFEQLEFLLSRCRKNMDAANATLNKLRADWNGVVKITK